MLAGVAVTLAGYKSDKRHSASKSHQDGGTLLKRLQARQRLQFEQVLLVELQRYYVPFGGPPWGALQVPGLME